jgi:DNA-binding transcriptional LysR family regulator
MSSAAKKLHLSQPAVSLQLKNLEGALGLSLFDRTPHGLVITSEGTVLLPEAEAALGALAGFARTAASLKGTTRDTLRVGTILDPEFTALGAFLMELFSAAPKLDTQLRHGMSDDVLAQIARHELDVGFYLDRIGAPPPGHDNVFRLMPLKQFVYRVAAPPGWGSRVHGKGWKALGKLPWLATPVASAHRRLLAGVFGPLGVEPERVSMTDDEVSMLDLVESGVGLSLVRDEMAERESRARKLVIADRVSIDCLMTFVCLDSRSAEWPIRQAWEAMERAWKTAPAAKPRNRRRTQI